MPFFKKSAMRTPGILPEAQDGQGLFSSPSGDLGLRILANNGPNQNLGSSLAQAIIGQRQSRAASQDDELRRQYMRAQIAQMGLKMPTQGPASIQEYEYAKKNGYGGSFEDWTTPKQGQASNASSIQEYNAARDGGFTGDYLSFIKAKTAAGATPAQSTFSSIQLGDGTWGVLDNRTGQIKPTGTKAPPKPASEGTASEQQAAMLATRLENAMRTMDSLEAQKPGSSSPTWLEKGAQGMPLIGGETAANFVRDPKRQQAHAAQVDALDAALTLATGAAYTKEQFAAQQASYFPQVNDDESTKADKRRRFRDLVNTARAKAGKSASSIDAVLGGTATTNTSGPSESDPLGIRK